MPRVPSILVLASLACMGCRVLSPEDLTAWKLDHGIRDSSTPGDTGLPLEPPTELCTGAWGRLNTSMDVDEPLRTVEAGGGMALMFWFAGPVDVCALGCDNDWVPTPYFTTDKNYTLEKYWVDPPLRLEDSKDMVYAMFYVLPPKDATPGARGECWVETSAGTRSFPLGIMKT
jgi:hypothetical protein